MKELDDVQDKLRHDACKLLEKRIERLRARKFVLFPWLRIKWLMRKYAKVNQLVGRGTLR
jgi:hypothetical protein